jgi:hypothetical protein
MPDVANDSSPARDWSVPSYDAGLDTSTPVVDSSTPGDDSSSGGDDASDASDELAPTGTPCSPVNSTESQPCPGCGTQQRVCLPGEAGAAVWQDWGACLNTVPDACAPPGEVTKTSCGRCGTQQSICQAATCTWYQYPCNEPADASCYPGSQSFVIGLSCTSGGRWSTCQSDCSWGAYGACTVLDGGALSGDYLVIPGTAGAKASKTFTLDSSTPIPVLTDSTCPSRFGTATASGFVQLINNSAKSATVSVWHAQASGGAALGTAGTVMGVYTTSLPPLAADTEGRAACSALDQGPCFDSVTDTAACQASFAGLMIGDSNQVTVPRNSWVWIYSASQAAGTGGPYVLTVMTNSLQ